MNDISKRPCVYHSEETENLNYFLSKLAEYSRQIFKVKMHWKTMSENI